MRMPTSMLSLMGNPAEEKEVFAGFFSTAPPFAGGCGHEMVSANASLQKSVREAIEPEPPSKTCRLKPPDSQTLVLSLAVIYKGPIAGARRVVSVFASDFQR